MVTRPFPGEWDDARVPPGGFTTKLQGSERVASSGECLVHPEEQYGRLGKEKNQSKAEEPEYLN